MTAPARYVTIWLLVQDPAEDALFHALAHATRRRILDVLREHPGINVNALAARFDVSRIAVMKHLGVLERADLVHSERRGRERLLWFNVVPIQSIHDRWTSEFSGLWAAGLTRFKYHLEKKSRSKRRVRR